MGGERIDVVLVLFTFRAEETKYHSEYDQACLTIFLLTPVLNIYVHILRHNVYPFINTLTVILARVSVVERFLQKSWRLLDFV